MLINIGKEVIHFSWGTQKKIAKNADFELGPLVIFQENKMRKNIWDEEGAKTLLCTELCPPKEMLKA